MAREARVVLEAVPYHITQRGNNRQDVFLLDDDRRFYIEVLRAKAREHGLTILGWCLMTNHTHLVAVPRRPDSLAKAVGQAHWRHTMRFNRRYGRSGHLWQGRSKRRAEASVVRRVALWRRLFRRGNGGAPEPPSAPEAAGPASKGAQCRGGEPMRLLGLTVTSFPKFAFRRAPIVLLPARPHA